METNNGFNRTKRLVAKLEMGFPLEIGHQAGLRLNSGIIFTNLVPEAS